MHVSCSGLAAAKTFLSAREARHFAKTQTAGAIAAFDISQGGVGRSF